MGESEIDNLWNPKGEYPIRPLVGEGKRRDNQVPDIFYEKTRLFAFEFWVYSPFFFIILFSFFSVKFLSFGIKFNWLITNRKS